MDFDRHMASMDYGEGSMMALMRGGGGPEQQQTGHHHDFMRSNMGYNNASSSTVASSNINEQQTHPNINSESLYQSAMYQAYYPNHLGSHHLMHTPQTQTGDSNAPLIANLPNQAMEGAFRLSESDTLRAQIMSHPQYPQLVTAYANCQKVGAPPEVVAGLDEISKEYQNHLSIRPALMGYGANPELDRFMEEYCNLLQGYHEELTKPFKEAMSFFRKVELQLNSLSKGTVRFSNSGEGQDKDAANASSEEEDGSCGEIEFHDVDPLAEEAKLKEQLLRKYSGYICTLKQEFLKKKKKGKLPKEARQKLLDWWNQHYKWPYPSETEKSGLAESTGLDQKQINNWFINQRKRHWKPSEDMHYAMDSPNSGAAHHHHPHHYQHHPYHHNPFNDSTPFKTEMGLIPMDQF